MAPAPRPGRAVCGARPRCRRRAPIGLAPEPNGFMGRGGGQEKSFKGSPCPNTPLPSPLDPPGTSKARAIRRLLSSSPRRRPRTPAESKRGHPAPVPVLVANAPRTLPLSSRGETATLPHRRHHRCRLHLCTASHHPVPPCATRSSHLSATDKCPRCPPPPQPPCRAWRPPDPAPAGPRTQAEGARTPRVAAAAYVGRDPQVPGVSLCLKSGTRDVNHQTRQLRLLKCIFYRIPRSRHGGLAVFVCGTLRFLPHPDVLYLQLVAHLTWQADVGLQVPELASGQKSLV